MMWEEAPNERRATQLPCGLETYPEGQGMFEHRNSCPECWDYHNLPSWLYDLQLWQRTKTRHFKSIGMDACNERHIEDYRGLAAALFIAGALCGAWIAWVIR